MTERQRLIRWMYEKMPTNHYSRWVDEYENYLDRYFHEFATNEGMQNVPLDDLYPTQMGLHSDVAG